MKEKVIEKIREAETPVYIRFGFGWKGAAWEKSNKEKLIKVLEDGNYAHYDVCTVADGIGINFYSANDML